MSTSSTPTNDSGMLAVGQQCEHPTCMMVDFLPFTCSHCKHKYCLEHFQPDAHTCPSHDPNAGDRVAPNCPLCNVPVSVPLGQDPNARMERHFASECMVMLGEMGRKRAAASRMPVCASRACNKKLIAPIQCTGCNMKFCAQHRYASDHDCPSEAAKAAALQKQAKAASASKPSSSTTSTPNRPAPQAAAALAALKRSVVSATTKTTKPTPAPTRTTTAPTRTTTAAAPKPAPKTSSGSSAPPPSTSTPAAPQPAPKHKPHNPFSKTDRCDPSPPPPASAASSSAQSSASSPTPQMQTGRDLDDLLLGSRARAEAESRRKALQERARKGVLSDADRQRLAEMDRQVEDADKEQCVVM